MGGSFAYARGSVCSIVQITLIPDPPSLQIQLDQRPQYRALKMGKREVMIALNATKMAKEPHKKGEKGNFFREYTVEEIHGGATTLSVSTNQDIGEIRTRWDESAKILTVALGPLFGERSEPNKAALKDTPKGEEGKEEPVKSHTEKEATQKTGLPDTPVKIETKPVDSRTQKKGKGGEAKIQPTPVTPQEPSVKNEPVNPSTGPIYSLSTSLKDIQNVSASPTGKITGGAEDLLLIIDGASCPERAKFQEALRQIQKKNWIEAFQLLNAEIQSAEKHNCLEKTYYLRSIVYHKMNQQKDEGLFLEVLSQLQDAVNYYPNSIYAPYAMTIIGTIYTELKNYSEAKGYFKIILDKYKDYPGRPEVMYRLGHIYAIEKNMKICIPIFKEIIASYPDNPLITEVKLELGKALYNSTQYSQSLELLNEVILKDPRKATDLEDILLYIGNNYYQLGKLIESRDALIRAYNLFPNSEANPVTLTRIGDILRDTGQTEKAGKIYQLVMDRYAGTDGSVISAMRKAALIEERSEKEKLYRMVIEKYSKHPMAGLATVKLSDLQLKAGEYRASIETLRPIFISNPKQLRAEVSYIMQAAFKGILSEMNQADSFPKIIALAQKEESLLRRFDNPELFMMLGSAFYKSHFFAEAVKLFEKADKFYNLAGPPELYYAYGMSLHATGAAPLSLKKFQEYIQKAPQGENIVSAHLMAGRILMDQKDTNGALNMLKKAEAVCKDTKEKIDILSYSAEASNISGDFKSAARFQSDVIQLLAASPDKEGKRLFKAYQQLGDIYSKMKSNSDAVSAYETALNYAGNEQPPELMFQLGETYQKAGLGEQAIKMYSQILAMEDDFWKNIARERLKRIQIESKIKMDVSKK